METLDLAFVGTGSVRDCYPPYGGWQKQIWGLAKELGGRGHQATIYGRRFTPGLRPPPGVRFVEVGNMTGAGPLTHLHFSARVGRDPRIRGADFVILWGERFAYLLLSRVNTFKAFVVDWDAIPGAAQWQRTQRPINWVFLPIKYRVEDRVRRACQVLYAMNETIQRHLEDSGYPRVERLRLGIDPSVFSNHSPDGYLLYVGRLHPSKGLDGLLQSFARIAHEFPDLSLVLVGGGPDGERLRSLAARLQIAEKVRFMGPVTDEPTLARIYSHCTAFVLPSLFEGLGIVILEAMASGKPVVASDIPGPKDVISHGKNGLLTPAGDPEALASTLSTLLSEEKTQQMLGRNARQEIEDRYTFRTTADTLLRTFYDYRGRDTT